MKLYEIDRAIENALELGFDPETGEVLGFEELEALQMEREKKIKNVVLWIKDMNAEAEMVKAEKQKLANRQSAIERKADSVKQFLSRYLNEGEKLKGGNFAISWRKSESVEISDENLVPDAYIRIKSEVDKTELKKALKLGLDVPGAELVTKNNLQIK